MDGFYNPADDPDFDSDEDPVMALWRMDNDRRLRSIRLGDAVVDAAIFDLDARRRRG